MHALSRSPISDTHFFISGTVTIDPSAAIAPGVLIQADPGARIVVHAGVCIGRGTIIHASSGTVDLGEGVTLGAGVLIFGTCQVGPGACVGANVTVIDHTVRAGQLVPANSVLTSLEIPSVSVDVSQDATNGSPAPAPPSQSGGETAESATDSPPGPGTAPEVESTPPSEPEAAVGVKETSADVQAAEVSSTQINVTTQRVVYGKSSLDQILTMMFPHRQPLNSPPSDQPDGS